MVMEQEEEFLIITAPGLSTMSSTAGRALDFVTITTFFTNRSVEKEKDWEIVFDFIFSEAGLINESYFITKHVGKFYYLYHLYSIDDIKQKLQFVISRVSRHGKSVDLGDPGSWKILQIDEDLKKNMK